MKSLLVLAALLSLAVAYSAEEYQQAFRSWMQKYDRAYTSEDFQTRFSAFQDNMDYVRDWNAKNSQTVLGLNFLADLTNEEYQTIYLGFRPTVARHVTRNVFVPSNETDDTVDWRMKGAVTGVKNQGQCGSCWAFSTTGSTEAAHFFAKGNLVSLSEQNLVDCSKPQGNNGCGGGDMDAAFTYIISNGGIDTEDSYQYTAQNGNCQFSAANVGATLASYTDIPSQNEGALTSAIVKSPVSVAIDASHSSFQLYSSGVYNEPACSTTSLDHGVLAVGYGSSGSDYYIVKNSWGTDWGQSGYIWMSRNNNNNCGIATMASYPTAKS